MSLITIKTISTPKLQGLIVANGKLEDFLHSESFSESWQQKQTLKQDRQRSVHVLSSPDGKQYLVKAAKRRFLERCKKALRLKPSDRALLEQLLQIKNQGISIPQPLAILGMESTPPLELTMMEYLPKAITLHACITRLLKEDPQAIQQLVHGVLLELVKLHRIGRVHGDMKLNNIMLSGTSIYLVDIDGRCEKKLGRYFQKDLARYLVGLIEVKVPAQITESVVKNYASEMDIHDEDFFEGVRIFIQKIIQRHQNKRASASSSMVEKQ